VTLLATPTAPACPLGRPSCPCVEGPRSPLVGLPVCRQIQRPQTRTMPRVPAWLTQLSPRAPAVLSRSRCPICRARKSTGYASASGKRRILSVIIPNLQFKMGFFPWAPLAPSACGNVSEPFVAFVGGGFAPTSLPDAPPGVRFWPRAPFRLPQRRVVHRSAACAGHPEISFISANVAPRPELVVTIPPCAWS